MLNFKKIKFIFLATISVITIIFFYTFSKSERENTIKSSANFYDVSLEKVFSLPKKRIVFVLHKNNFTKFNLLDLDIYTQDGYLIKNSDSTKINLIKDFTLEKNGGIKSIFFIKNKTYALVSSLNNNCFYASIIELETSRILKKFPCLTNEATVDFNALGGAYVNIKNKEKIYLSLGVGERLFDKNSNLAQIKESYYGKILSINTNQFDFFNDNHLDLEIFSLGHRNPQGMTSINENIFSVEHGPRGGDELNKILKDKNYGWPLVTYGGKYFDDPLYNKGDDSEGIQDHESNGFEEPLFVLTPSVGISSLSFCPLILKKIYSKNCLLSLTLNGKNNLMIVYVLNKSNDKVLFHEKIYFNKPLRMRNFVTDINNEIFEDSDGNIYVSVDNDGIYKVKFFNFKK